MRTDDVERRQLAAGLRGGDAHMTFEAAVAGFPDDAINTRPPNIGYTPWHLVEHLRRTQRDMLDYLRDPRYTAPAWPDDYWPDPAAVTTPAGFRASVDAFVAERTELEALVLDARVDINAPLAHSPAHTVARCVRVIANHNSYHVGEIAILRQVMGTWGPDHDAPGGDEA